MGRISEEDKRYLLSLKPEDITYELGMKLFADTVKKENGKIVEVKSRFEPTDTFILKSSEYFNKRRYRNYSWFFLYLINL